MTKQTSGFTIKEKELAKVLEITHEKLIEIIDFFNSDPTDQWELKENYHFVYLIQANKTRLFSEQGAFAIAKYMDEHSPKNFWNSLVEFLTKHKQKIRNAFIGKKIQDNSSSLILRNKRHFLSKKDVISILCTSPARLNKAFEEVQKSEGMKIYEDFEDLEVDKKDVRYYSLAGFYKLARNLGNSLTVKDRQGWCGAIEVVGNKTFGMIISEQDAWQKKVDSAMGIAKTKDNKTCQITGAKNTGVTPDVNICAHHIYSKDHYPLLAASADNLICLKEFVHKEFHAWNGGFSKPCTPDDLIRFITELYSDDEEYPNSQKVIFRLGKVKQIFGTPEPIKKVSIISSSSDQT